MAMTTTTIAPMASDRITAESSRNSPASDTTTVMPENTTVAPDVRIAMSSASPRSRPAWISSR
jgi:hypothetical protein